MIDLDTPIEKLKFVGARKAKPLKNIGIHTIRHLLWHFPTRYDDYTEVKPIGELKVGDEASIEGEIESVKTIRIWGKRKLTITTAIISDGTGTIRAVWFQPYIERAIPKGTRVGIAGKVRLDKKGPVISSPAYEKISDAGPTHTARLVPKYPETTGITSRYFRFLIKPLLAELNGITDSLPSAITKKYGFGDINQSLKNIHFPAKLEDAKKAQDRMAFEELLLFQLKALQSRRALSQFKAPSIKFDQNIVKKFVDSLPFILTGDQKIASFEILKDLEKTHPMNRLLDGDVGSGKTVVALIAAFETAKAGYQVAFMAPTEILAQQHYKTIKSLLVDTGVQIDLLTSSTKPKIKKEIISSIKNDFSQIVVGTHALIQKEVTFQNLALVVVDEQHRFGIEQRRALLMEHGTKNMEPHSRASSDSARNGASKKMTPHLLSMTATPIPRTLALTIYGDLDVSLLKEKPKDRRTIITKVVPPLEKKGAYKFIDDEITKGHQAFIICPRIEISDPTKPVKGKLNILWQDVKAVTDEYEKISKNVFPHRKAAMLHGKMKPKEKEEIMTAFKDGLYDIIISTSVVEVGVDVPNATVMAIENAERFGLAQLHQFRGRVGRAEHQSHCLLMCGTEAQMENERLLALVTSDDGFSLAQKDLEIRGPGQFFGTQQSGMADFAMASLANIDLIKKARAEAMLLLKTDPSLNKYPELKKRLTEFQKMRHFE